jgi:hypothetical protein
MTEETGQSYVMLVVARCEQVTLDNAGTVLRFVQKIGNLVSHKTLLEVLQTIKHLLGHVLSLKINTLEYSL